MRISGLLFGCAAACGLASPTAGARDTAGPERKAAPKPSSAVLANAPISPSVVAPPPEAAPAHAPPTPLEQPAPSDTVGASAEQAKQLYALGAEAFAAQRHADAIRYFRRAAELVPNAKLTYNIALAYEEMGDTGRALAEYRAYLRNESEVARTAALAEQVAARVAELEARLASSGVQQLSVLTDPSGATLEVSGRVIGVTPWSGEFTPGLHAITLELPGHQPYHADAAVSLEHASDLRVALSPEPEPPPPPPPTRSSGGVQPITWGFLGVGTAALAGGVAFELSRKSSSDEAGRAGTPVDAAEARGAADAKQMASLTLLGFGTGFSIGGGILLALDLSRDPDIESKPTQLGVPCAPEFCGITASGNF